MGSLLKISEAASIALHSLVVLSQRRDKLTSVKEIATALQISANHLSKVMQRLCKAGYIESIKGVNGGFRLIVDPESLPFIDIYELFDGKIADDSCLLSRDGCQKNCIFGDLIDSVNKQVKKQFENTKISDFLSKHILD